MHRRLGDLDNPSRPIHERQIIFLSYDKRDFDLQYFLHRHPWVLFHEYMNHLKYGIHTKNHDIPLIFVERLERINVNILRMLISEDMKNC